MPAVQTKFDVIEQNLKIALDLASDCYRAYTQASDHDRRQFNQAFFTHIYVDQDEVRADLAEPFLTLIPSSGGQPSASLHNGRHANARQDGVQAGASLDHWAASFDEGVKEAGLVPPAGFEPATPGLGEPFRRSSEVSQLAASGACRPRICCSVGMLVDVGRR
jgi:site-specific DNA recombinase